MIDTYDKDTETFFPLSSLSGKKKHTIAKLIFSDVDDIVNELEKDNKDRNIFRRTFTNEKANNQNALDAQVQIHVLDFG